MNEDYKFTKNMCTQLDCTKLHNMHDLELRVYGHHLMENSHKIVLHIYRSIDVLMKHILNIIVDRLLDLPHLFVVFVAYCCTCCKLFDCINSLPCKL